MESSPGPNAAASGSGESDLATLIMENAGPIGGQLTMGALFGYCSGYALQKAGS